MNIDFNLENNMRFNTRCSAIIYNKEHDKILVFKMDGRDNYMLPGGRIEFFEDSNTAIKREIKEELGYDLDFTLCSIQENFLNADNKKIMQYCFCYFAVYEEKITEETFRCLDNPSQTFCWIPIKNIEEYQIVPNSTITLIKNSCNFKHFIEKI